MMLLMRTHNICFHGGIRIQAILFDDDVLVFTSLLTLFNSYQDKRRVIAKGSV